MSGPPRCTLAAKTGLSLDQLSGPWEGNTCAREHPHVSLRPNGVTQRMQVPAISRYQTVGPLERDPALPQVKTRTGLPA